MRHRITSGAVVVLALVTRPALACESVAPSAPERLMRPVSGDVLSGFGMRLHPLLGIRKMHEGVDFEVSVGEPVLAAADGRVVAAGAEGAYGIAVRLEHGGGLETLSAHLVRTTVKAGDCIRAGMVIGQSGTTGLTERPKLHFEVRSGGTPIDPGPLLP